MKPDVRKAMRDAIRAALTTADLPAARLEHPGPLQLPVDAGAQASPDLITRFRTELEALGGQVHTMSSAGEIVALVQELLARERASSVLAWDDGELPVQGLADALARAGTVVHRPQAGDASDRTRRGAWAEAGVGITGADACLAETGSIVVVSGPGRARLASLLPPVHIALARRSSLRPSLAAVFAEQPALATSGANMVCITGPSRTADIEHTLSRGVHGPREIHVVLTD